MIIETIVWLIFSIFIVWLSAVKMKHFMKDKAFNKATKELNDLKHKPSKSKTIDDKMDYVRQKTENGQDFMSMILSTIIYIIGFGTMIYPNITNIYSGIIVAVIFSLLFAYLFSKLAFDKNILAYKFIDSFIGYLFASTLMVYVKFIHNMHILLLLGLSLVVMILINKTMDKLVGNEIIKR